MLCGKLYTWMLCNYQLVSAVYNTHFIQRCKCGTRISAAQLPKLCPCTALRWFLRLCLSPLFSVVSDFTTGCKPFCQGSWRSVLFWVCNFTFCLVQEQLWFVQHEVVRVSDWGLRIGTTFICSCSVSFSVNIRVFWNTKCFAARESENCCVSLCELEVPQIYMLGCLTCGFFFLTSCCHRNTDSNPIEFWTDKH